MLFKGQLYDSFCFFGRAACGILVSRPEIEPSPPAVEVQSPNYCTTREVPVYIAFDRQLYLHKAGENTTKNLSQIQVLVLLR